MLKVPHVTNYLTEHFGDDAFATVDGYVAAPLRGLAREAGTLTVADSPVVVVTLKRVPSIAFYADRAHVRLRKRKETTLREMVAAGRPFAGIAPATEKEFARLRGIQGIRIVREAGGYVLFAHPDRD